MARARVGAAGLAALAVAVAPAAAHGQAITFGTDLNRPPNVAIDCTQVPFTNFTYASGFTSCTWANSGRFMDSRESFVVPSGNGILTAARVRTGPGTGPMRIDILSTLRAPTSTIAACCKSVAQSQVFTPAPNAVTTIPLNIPVVNGPTVTGVLEFDTMALTVLQAGVPVPLHNTLDYDTLSGPAAGVMYPAILPGQERSDVAGTFGYQVLLNADWVPAPGAPQGPGATVPTSVDAPATVGLQTTQTRVSAGRVPLALLCGQLAACAGTVRLQNAVVPTGRPRASAAATRTYASTSFTLAAGELKKVRAKLGKTGRSALRRRNSISAWVNVTTGGTSTTLGRVTIAR